MKSKKVHGGWNYGEEASTKIAGAVEVEIDQLFIFEKQKKELKKPSALAYQDLEIKRRIIMKEIPEIIKRFRQANQGKELDKLVAQYFDLLDKLYKATREKNGSGMLQYSMMSLSLIEPFIISEKKEYGAFVIREMPGVDTFAMLNAVIGNEGQLNNLRDIISFFPELKSWKSLSERAFRIKKIVSKIYEYVKNNEGCLQKNLWKSIGIEDKDFIREIVYHMDLMGKINRKKAGNTYCLFINN